MPTKSLCWIKAKFGERGTHDELLQLQGQYAEMVALQKANPIDSVSFRNGVFF